MKPTMGRIVLYRGDGRDGAVVYPAIISRVHESEGDTLNGEALIDATAFPPATPPYYVTRVRLFDTEPDESHSYAAWWPPRD